MASLVRLLLCVLGLAAALPPLAQAATAYAPRRDTVAQCAWDRPGHDPFVGDVVAAIDRYSDIPTPVRMRLKERMQARQYDDLADIRRDSISGKFQYASAIRDMHFGRDRVCRQVTRTGWTEQTHERGLVYCEGEHCILVPTVCRNVSRIDRQLPLVAGDALKPPPTVPPAPPLASGEGREAPAGAGVPVPPATPITSSFSEAVAGAAIPLFGPTDGSAVPDAGTTPGGLPFPPVLFVSGGGGAGPIVLPPGGTIPVGGTPDNGGGGGGDIGGGGGGPIGGDGGGGGAGGGVPIDPGTPPVSPIPEPATWASLISGLLLLVLVVQRQRRAKMRSTQ